ncbi:MAG: hypothetical protein WBP12_03190 [Candidatus Saccharimonas sp.]
METTKTTVLLNIFSSNKMLLRTVQYSTEGYEVLDSFGLRLESPEQAEEYANNLVRDIVQMPCSAVFSGKMVDHIRKSQGNVRLETIVYRVEIESRWVALTSDQAWYSRHELEQDHRFKRDRHLLPYYFAKNTFSIEFAEDQMGRWRDATLLWLKEID